MRRPLWLTSFACGAFVLVSLVPARVRSQDSAAPAAPATPASTLALTNDHVAAVEAAVRVFAGSRPLKETLFSVAVLDVDSGHLLAAQNEHTLLNPASNEKLYTAAAALATLHGDFRYETTLSGAVKGSEAKAIVLRGHGDPSLTTADFAAMVEELRAEGVRKVGDILVDQKLFDGETTPPAFDQKPDEWAAFRAPVSAVAVNENTITLTVRPTSSGSPALASFDPPGFVDADGDVKTGDVGADTVGLDLKPNGQRLAAHLSGTIGSDAKRVRYTRRVDDPQLLAGYVLKALLERAQVPVSGEVKLGSLPKAKLIVHHQSAPLSELLLSLGKQSDNFYAEMIWKSIGGEAKARPAKSEDGADVATKWLSSVGVLDDGMVLKNGSGLYDADRVTTASLVSLLRVAIRDPGIGPEYVAQLAIGGVDGTLHKRLRRERDRRCVRAKTGTLDDVAALSGYVLGPHGQKNVAFSILVNHAAGKVSGVRAAMDDLVEAIAKTTWGD